MPNPYKQIVYDKFWTLLEANAPFTTLATEGRRFKQDGDGWLRRQLMRAPGDFPNVEITNGRFTHSAYTTDGGLTYALEQAVTDLSLIGDSIIRRRCEYVMTITARDTKSTNIDPIEEAAQVAILIAGPRLGLAFVKEWGPLNAEQKEISDASGTARLQSKITIPVLMEFLAATLTT